MASNFLKSLVKQSKTQSPMLLGAATSVRSFHSTKPALKSPFHPTQPVQSVGQAIILAGFATLAFGAKYYVNGYRAYNNEVARRNDELFAKTGQLSEIYKNKRFYTGAFDEKMTPKEAALILGCRESACKELIMDRYRVLIRQNHPDLGGSPYIASKVNDAKTLLATAARSDPEYMKKKAERELRAKKRQAEEQGDAN